MPDEFSTIGPRALIRAKHVTELQDRFAITPTSTEVTAEIADTVPPLVTTALSSDPVLQAAVTDTIAAEDIPGQVSTAVTDDIAGRDLVESNPTVLTDVGFVAYDQVTRKATSLVLRRNGEAQVQKVESELAAAAIAAHVAVG